ncbi:MAG: FKBP-type peptidyl-prolyl cis-trans isomerase [Cryomorphaceae bacterium]
MKKIAFFAGLLVLMGSAACAQKGDKKGNKGAKSELATEMDSISYIFGASLGQNVKQAEIEGVDSDRVMQGFLDATEGEEEEMKISMEDGNNYVRAFMMKEQAKKAEKSKKYLEDLADDPDYTATESGILYKVLEQGSGDKPEATQKVRVNYEGKTTDGKVFDSSYERGEPAEFPLNRVIPGWTEMLQLMEVGTTVEAVIPSNLAYGEQGSPPKIGPNETLIFKIELIEILKEE